MTRTLLAIALLLLATTGFAQQSLPVIRLTGTFGSDYQSGTVDIEGQSYPVSVKWRGASTGGSDKHKHNYKLKFGSNHQFFGMRNDNNWILDAGQVDPFRLRNRIATDLWLDFATAPYYAESLREKPLSGARGRVVELYLNGQYEGIYSFGENMDRKQMQLRKFDSQIRGVLWKAEGYQYTGFWDVENDYDNTLPTWGAFEAKYPDLDDRSQTDYSTLYEAINFVVNSSDDEFVAHAADYFDLPVVMDNYLFINVMGAIDNIGKNTFWAVYDRTAADHRLTPAVWDLDLTVGAPRLAAYNPEFVSPVLDMISVTNLVYRLQKLNVDNFCERSYERYEQLRQGVLHTDSLIGRYQDWCNLLYNTGAAQREIDRWSGDSDLDSLTIDFRRDVDSISQWLRVHMAHLDTVLTDTAVHRLLGIHEVRTWQPSAANRTAVYNLQGQRQRTDLPLRPGIYIRGGRKFITRKTFLNP